MGLRLRRFFDLKTAMARVAPQSLPRSEQQVASRERRLMSKYLQILILTAPLLLCVTSCFCQTQPQRNPKTDEDLQINVNWLYGSYVPKDVPLTTLNGHQRLKLYIRQTYTTPGIYVKTTAFALHDQVHEANPEWGDGFEGFAKRLGSRQAQFIIQNSLTSFGDGVVGWEPRYDRCRCRGGWSRTRHAIVRNFVTYDRTEKSLRPQIMLFLAAFAGGAIATNWEPAHPNWKINGYQAMLTQIPIGVGINLIGEFAPEIGRIFRKKKAFN